ncbi:hypothetical protein [Microbacterium sp.]
MYVQYATHRGWKTELLNATNRSRRLQGRPGRDKGCPPTRRRGCGRT